MKMLVKSLGLIALLSGISFANTCTLSAGTYANLAATAGHWTGSGCTGGAYVPTTPDIVILPTSGANLTLASGDFLELGSSSAAVGVAFSMPAGVSAVSYSTFTLQHGATLQLDALDISTNYMADIEQFQHFNSAGSILGHLLPTTKTIFQCNGMCSIVGSSPTTPGLMSIVSSDRNWNNNANLTVASLGTNLTYYRGGNVLAFPVFGQNQNPMVFVSNSAGTGPYVFGDSSLAFSSISCSPACTGGNLILQTPVSTLALVTSAGKYFFDRYSGVIFFWTPVGGQTQAVSYTVNYKYLTFPTWSIINQNTLTYSAMDVENTNFVTMGSTTTGNRALTCVSKLSAGAGGTQQGCVIKNNVFDYDFGSANFSGNTGTSSDPIVFSSNTISTCYQDASGGTAGCLLVAGNTYLDISSNTVLGSLIYFMNMSGTNSHLTITNNIINSTFGMSCFDTATPDITFDGNLMSGYGNGGNDSRNIFGCYATSGHPFTVSNNVFMHGLRWMNIASNNTVINNVILEYPHHGMMGSVDGGQFISTVTIANNIMAIMPPGASDTFNLGYNTTERLDNINVSHNTIYAANGFFGLDLSGDGFDNAGNTRENYGLNHSNIISSCTIGLVRSPNTTTFGSGLYYVANGWNDIYGNGTNYQSWNQFSTVVGTNNVTGVSLFDPSATLPLSGKTLAFTNTSAINKTLTWDGGSPVQLFITSGTATSGTNNTIYGTLTDTSHNFPTDYTNSSIPTTGWIVITGGTGSGQIRNVILNTNDTLYASPFWTTTPDATSTYALYRGEVVLTASGGSTIHAGTYWPLIPSSTVSDTSVSVLANSYSVDPQFVDPTVNLATWDSFVGGPGTEGDAQTRLIVDKSLVRSSLLPYLQNGFKPQNSVLFTAGYDGQTVGAVQNSSVVSSTKTCTLNNGTYTSLSATAGHWLGTGCTGGSYVPTSPDTVVILSSGTNFSLAPGDFWSVGSTNPVGIAFKMITGISSTSYSTFTVVAGSTLQVAGIDLSGASLCTNCMGHVQPYQHFNLYGTMLGNTAPSSNGSEFHCNGMCTIIGATVTVPTANIHWNNNGSYTTSNYGPSVMYYAGGHVYGAPVSGNGLPAYFISNAAGTGPYAFGDSSLSFSSISCSPACTGGDLILQNPVNSIEAVLSPGDFFYQDTSGLIFFYLPLTNFTQTVTFTTNFKYEKNPMWAFAAYSPEVPFSSPYTATDVENSLFEFVGSTVGAEGVNGLMLDYKKSTGAGGDHAWAKAVGNMFKYVPRSLTLAEVIGSADDPIIISSNTIWSCLQDTSNGCQGCVFPIHDAFVNFTNNVIMGTNQVWVFNSDGPEDNFNVKNNVFNANEIFQCNNRGVPNLLVDGNLINGYGQAEFTQGMFPQCYVTSAYEDIPTHPNLTYSNNVINHAGTLWSLEDQSTITGNVILGTTFAGFTGPNVANSVASTMSFTNNIMANASALSPYNLSLGYATNVRINAPTITHNTFYNNQGLSTLDLAGNSYFNSQSVGQNRELLHSNLISSNLVGVTKTTDTATFASRLNFTVNGWSDVYNNTTQYSGWNQFSTIAGTANVTGVSLFNPSATLPITGKTLAFTNTSSINKTLTWDGGSPVQLFITSGTLASVSSLEPFTLTDNSQNFASTYNASNSVSSAWFVITGGTDSGDIQMIDIAASSRTIVVSTFTVKPDNTSTYAIYKAEVLLTASGGSTVQAGTYWPSIPGSTVSDTNISITTNTFSVDPQFINPTVNMASWDSYIGGPGTETDALARLEANTPLIQSSLLPYLQQGFKPQNVILSTAAYDRTTIGAVQYSSSVLAMSGPTTCQQGQTCHYAASGGVPPYSFAMVGASSGSVDSFGNYTVPTHIVPRNVINGCQATPNNSVWNTPINNLPLSSSNTLFMSNMDQNSVYFDANTRLNNTVFSTDVSTPMIFQYTPITNGNFIFPSSNTLLCQSGCTNGLLAGGDNHFFVTYKDTCQQQENYQLYPYGINLSNPGGNSQGGVIYPLERFDKPGAGTDAAFLPIGVNLIHDYEIQNAIAGDVDAIKHATRMTMDTVSIGKNIQVWPSPPLDSLEGCQGYNVLVNTLGTAVTLSSSGGGPGFRIGWPSGMTLTINGTNYTLASTVTSSTTLTLSSSAGTQSSVLFSMPTANCAPYGSRLRMRSSFTWPGFDGLCTTTACQNIVNAIIKQQKTYGMFLADVGTSWSQDIDNGRNNPVDLTNALIEIYTHVLGSSMTYEVVDESSLNTSSTTVGTDQNWTEVKIDNPYVTPLNAAMIRVTDSVGSTKNLSVALQGVAIGVNNETEVVMAGASPAQFTPWVTGSSNTGFTCSMSPSGGSTGTITSACLFTAASSNTVTGRSEGVVTVTASADNTVTRTFNVVTVPVSSDNLMRIGLGKGNSSTDYTDLSGKTWINDSLPTHPVFFPENNAGNNGTFGWTGTNTSVAPGLYDQGFLSGQNDVRMPVWVSNGIHTAHVYLGNLMTGTSQQAFSMDCNGVQSIGYTDAFTFNGGATLGTGDASCTVNVTNGLMDVVIRMQGVNPQSYGGYTIPLYGLGNAEYLAGLTIDAGTGGGGGGGTLTTNTIIIRGRTTIRGRLTIQ